MQNRGYMSGYLQPAKCKLTDVRDLAAPGKLMEREVEGSDMKVGGGKTWIPTCTLRFGSLTFFGDDGFNSLTVNRNYR